MKMTIIRQTMKGEITEGTLQINRLEVCQTLEHTQTRLPAGCYPVTLHRCKYYEYHIIQIGSRAPRCARCPEREDITTHTCLPRRCPMIKRGNGIHGRKDGSILVGTWACTGLLIHTKEAFGSLSDRVRKCISRGQTVTLEIIE